MQTILLESGCITVIGRRRGLLRGGSGTGATANGRGPARPLGNPLAAGDSSAMLGWTRRDSGEGHGCIGSMQLAGVDP